MYPDIQTIPNNSLYNAYPNLTAYLQKGLDNIIACAEHAKANPVTDDVGGLLEATRDQRDSYELWRTNCLLGLAAIVKLVPDAEAPRYLHHLGVIIRNIHIPSGTQDAILMHYYHARLASHPNTDCKEVLTGHHVDAQSRLTQSIGAYDDYINCIHRGRAPKRHFPAA